MKLACPNCGTFGSLELFASDADARHCVQLAAKMPPALERSVFTYLGLFQPPKRVLTWKRTRKLLAELVDAIATGQVERHGRPWAAPHAAWQAAFDQMTEQRDKLTLPLKSHGYLFEIVAGGANRAEAVAEESRERLRRAPPDRFAPEEPRADAQDLTAVLAASIVAGENRVRNRMGLPSMSPAEESEFLTRAQS